MTSQACPQLICLFSDSLLSDAVKLAQSELAAVDHPVRQCSRAHGFSC